MTDTEWEEGLETRKARVVIAASDCVHHLQRQATGMIGHIDQSKLLAFLTQARFSPVYQRELVEAVEDLRNFETGSGKYQLSDAERLVKLRELVRRPNAPAWAKVELERLTTTNQTG